ATASCPGNDLADSGPSSSRSRTRLPGGGAWRRVSICPSYIVRREILPSAWQATVFGPLLGGNDRPKKPTGPASRVCTVDGRTAAPPCWMSAHGRGNRGREVRRLPARGGNGQGGRHVASRDALCRGD